MSGTGVRMDPNKAAVDLARLMERQMGWENKIVIDPVAFRLFIQAYWSRVAVYAHAIHDCVEPVHMPPIGVLVGDCQGGVRWVP